MSGPPSTTRRRCLGLLAGVPVLLTGSCATTAEKPPEEDFEYRPVIPATAASGSGEQEVIEFFWYGCPHCRAFEPLLQKWQRSLSPDVRFRKVHVALGSTWVAHQQLYFSLESIDQASNETNRRVFDAIHVDGVSLDSRDRIADFVAGIGVDRARFVAAFDSQAVKDRMSEADRLAVAMGVKGVPGLGVNGRWFTSPGMAGDQASALRVADYLLARDRQPGSK